MKMTWLTSFIIMLKYDMIDVNYYHGEDDLIDVTYYHGEDDLIDDWRHLLS